MNLDPVLYRRIVEEARGLLPLDLYAAIVQVLSDQLSAPERVGARDTLLREAGELIGGSTWHRMTRIRAAISSPPPAGDAVGDLVTEAIALTPGRVPKSTRQLLRILQCH